MEAWMRKLEQDESKEQPLKIDSNLLSQTIVFMSL